VPELVTCQKLSFREKADKIAQAAAIARAKNLKQWVSSVTILVAVSGPMDGKAS